MFTSPITNKGTYIYHGAAEKRGVDARGGFDVAGYVLRFRHLGDVTILLYITTGGPFRSSTQRNKDTMNKKYRGNIRNTHHAKKKLLLYAMPAL